MGYDSTTVSDRLGVRFRDELFPGDSNSFLRLHNSYRHDLKIYSSDEGRVQMTAAAFARGFLDLEGFLTPILASLVSKRPPSLRARRERTPWDPKGPQGTPGYPCCHSP